MNIYYRDKRLCGVFTGNGARGNWLESFAARRRGAVVRKIFPISDINTVLYNRHASIGCSVRAPLRHIGWRHDPIRHILPCGVEAYIPQNISFTEGNHDIYLVVIDGVCELRFWPHSRSHDRDEAEWFSHMPIIHFSVVRAVKMSFDALLAHIRKEDALAAGQRPATGK